MKEPPTSLQTASFDDLTAEQMRSSRRLKWLRYDRDVLPAWVAEMDFPLAPTIRAAIESAIADEGFGYHPLPIDPRLREAFVAWMRQRFAWDTEPDMVRALTNVVQGLDIGILLYSKPGQGVVFQTPIYGPFHIAVDGNRRRRVESPLVYGTDRYEIDWDHLRAVIDSDTRVFLLCNPHNPSGRAFTREELETLAELVLEKDLMVVSDEIHADLVYAPHRHLPFASLGPEIAARTLTVTSATKAFNIAGLPMAVAVAGGVEMKKRLRDLPPMLPGHGGHLGNEAAIAAWSSGSAWLEEVLTYLDANRAFVTDFIGDRIPGIRYHPPEATYLAWLDCRALDLPEGPFDFFLNRARVALSNGADFADPGHGHVRLNFATSRRILSEILERIASTVPSLSDAPFDG